MMITKSRNNAMRAKAVGMTRSGKKFSGSRGGDPRTRSGSQKAGSTSTLDKVHSSSAVRGGSTVYGI